MRLFAIGRALAIAWLSIVVSGAGALDERALTVAAAGDRGGGTVPAPQPGPRGELREAPAPAPRRPVPVEELRLSAVPAPQPGPRRESREATALIPHWPISVEELRLYTEAFHEARAAGHILLDKIAPIIAAVALPGPGEQPDASDCSVDRHGAPKCFDPRLAVAAAPSSDPQPIAVRRAALELISAYNGMLIELANGREPRELQSRLGEVVELAGTVLVLTGGAAAGLPALVPPVVAGLDKLTERLGTARAAAVTRQEILDARHTIKALLAQLKEDTPKLYEIYRLKRLDDRREALSQNRTELAEAASNDLRQFHASVAAYFMLIGRTAEALDTLAAAASDPAAHNPHSSSGIFRGALDLRRDAKAFWDRIRRVGDGRR
jgi:hypothetical protein